MCAHRNVTLFYYGWNPYCLEKKKSSGLGIWLTFLWTQNTPFHCHFGLVLSGAKMSTFFQEYRNKMLRLQLSLFQSHFFILTSFKLQRERTNSSWHQSYLFSLQEKKFLLQFPVPPAGTVHFLLASVCFCARREARGACQQGSGSKLFLFWKVKVLGRKHFLFLRILQEILIVLEANTQLANKVQEF